jgi:glycosyltransferase involved in cell wall biosynthesis
MTPNEFAFNGPLGSVSFGQCSFAILREMHKRGLQPSVFPIGGGVDLSTQRPDDQFTQWLGHCINKAQGEHCRKRTSIKLWHIQNSLESYSETDSRLLTFHETDQLTPAEVNILRNQDKVYVTSRFTQQVFKMFGIDSEYAPLGYDAHNFPVLEKRPKVEGAVSFAIAGKFEERKAHGKTLRAWAKKYGNNPKYRLNAALHNPFLKPEHLNALIGQALEGKAYYNINFLPYMATNAEYNSFLQSSDIFLSMSGGEGWNLPLYHAMALGAHAVVMNAHAHSDFCTQDNAVLVNPNSKRPAADGIFFHQNAQFSVGNFFDYADDAFVAGMEEAEKRATKGLNTEGLKLQQQTFAQTVDVLLKDIK